MNSRERYEQARDLIRDNKFLEARKVLLPIRSEARATEWLEKIDARLAKLSPVESPVKKKGGRSLVTTIATLFFILIAFLIGLAVGGYTLDLDPEPTAEAVQSVIIVTATGLPATEMPLSTPAPIETSTPMPISTAKSPTPFPTFTPVDTVASTPMRLDLPTVDVGEEDIGKWIYDSNVSALDDSSSYFILLLAEDTVRTWLSEATPTLIIRCSSGEYDAYIHTDSQLESSLDDEVFTRVRYGDGSPVSLTMSESTTGEAIFFPNPNVAIRSMLAVNRLVVGYTPFNSSPVEAIFDLTGMNAAIDPLARACGNP